MPVFGTPIASPSPISTDCASVTVLAPDVTQIYGQTNPRKMQMLEVNQGQAATITWVMKNAEGDPVDFSLCGSSVKLRIREALYTAQAPGTEITGTITDATAGEVAAVLTSDVVGFPGISIGEFAVLNGSGVVVFTNMFYLVVNRGQFGTATSDGGPPTMAEIRLHLRDSGPEDNYLLDEVEFDGAEIAASIIRPIDQFNAMQPPIDQLYNTSNFPWRYYWLEGIIGNLFTTAAHHYRRNHLPYSAAGVSIDDKNKEMQYLQAAMLHKKNWEDFAKAKKVQLNMEAGFGQVLSGYSYYSDYTF